MKTSHPITAIIAIMILAIIGSCSSNDIPVEPEGPPAPHLSREDSLVLVTLYKEGGGEFWDNKWDLNDKVENWKGISCYLVDTPKNEYRVNALHLLCNTNGPRGILSEDIEKLSYLEVLLMDGEGFAGTLPASLSNLKDLKEVSIIGTSISGQIPEGILSLPELRRLTLARCELSGELPKDIIDTAPSLEYINFSENHLTGEIPKFLNSNVIILDLWYNDFIQYPFEYITQRKEHGIKTVIDMKFNKITGAIPDSILNNPEWLKDLEIYGYPQKEGYGYSNAPWPY